MYVARAGRGRAPAIMPSPPGPPMTLGNMRELGVRSLAVTCELCHHEAVLPASRWSDAVLVRAFRPRMVCPYRRRCHGLISHSPSLSLWSNYQRSLPRMTAEVVVPYAVLNQYSTGCYARVRRAVGTYLSVPNGVGTHSSARTGDCFWSTRTSIVASNENIPPSLEQKRHSLRTARWCSARALIASRCRQ